MQLTCTLLLLLVPRLASATIDVGPTASLWALGGKELEYAIIVEAYENCSEGCQIYAVDTRKAGFTPLFRKKLGSSWDEQRSAHCKGIDDATCSKKLQTLYATNQAHAESDLERYIKRLRPTERAQLEPIVAASALSSWSFPKQTPSPSPKGVAARMLFAGEGQQLQLQVRELWDVASVRAYDGDYGCNPKNLPACQAVTRYVNGVPYSTWSCPQAKVHNKKGPPIDCGGRALMVQLEARLDGGSIINGSKALLEPFKLISNWRGMIASRGMAIEGLSLQVGVHRLPHGLLVVGGLTDGAMNGTWFPAVMTIPLKPWPIFSAAEASAFVSQGRQQGTFPLTVGQSRIIYDGKHEVVATSRFFDLVREAAPDFSFTRQGKTLLLDYQLLQFGEKALYDGEDWSKSYFKDQLHREEARTDFGLRFEPLSLVGDVVTWATVKQHRGLSGFWYASDLSTGEPPALLKLFDEASLITALLDNPCVQEGVRASKERVFSSLAQLIESYQEPLGTDCPRRLDRFMPAFSGYDSDKDLALVELGYARTLNNNYNYYQPHQMGFYIQPTPAFRDALKATAAGDGFFIDELSGRGFF